MADLPPRTPPGRRSRRRRGSLERPVSTRIYRVSLALVALPMLVLAFTVGRPEPLPRPPLPPSFDAAAAIQDAEEFARLFPDRSPTSPNRREAIAWLRDRLESAGLGVVEQRFTAEIPGLGKVPLVNVVARPLAAGPARSPNAIVVTARWDNLGLSPGLDGNASGIGALLELARDFSTISVTHTIVFAALDGGSYGSVGAARLAANPSFRGRALATLNLDSVASTGPIRLELAGDGAVTPSGTLAATADTSVLRQTGVRATHANGFLQLVDLAFPFSLYGQSPMLGQGISSVTFTTAGARPPTPAEDVAAIDPARMQAVGRSAQSLVASLDTAAEAASGTESFVYLGGRLLRGFAVSFLFLVLLVPVVVATIDLWARLRRRGLELGPALRSYRSRLGVWLWAGGIAALLTFLGTFPNEGDRPLSPDTPPAQDWPSAALAGLAALTLLGWFAARVRLVPRTETSRHDELAGHLAAMIVLCVVAVGVAVVNIFALLFVLPSLHLWLWTPHVRDSALWARALLLGLGFAGPVGLLAVFAVERELGWDAPWYVATLFSVGYAPWSLLLLLLAWGAAAGQIGAILFGRYAPYPSHDHRPERGLLRESVRQAALLARRLRRGHAVTGQPSGRGTAAPEETAPLR